MAYVRAMSAAKPYLYLMDTSFADWTIQDTAAYHDVCLLRCGVRCVLLGGRFD
jgi:hypothetical protein